MVGRSGSTSTFSNARPRHLIWAALPFIYASWAGWRGYRDSGSVRFFSCPGVVLAIAGVALYHRLTVTHPGLVQVRLSPAGCSQIDDPSRHGTGGRVTRWSRVKDVELTRGSPGTVRVRVRAPAPLWRMVNYPVDAEVRCTAGQTAALRARIHAWRTTAAGANEPRA